MFHDFKFLLPQNQSKSLQFLFLEYKAVNFKMNKKNTILYGEICLGL